MRRCPTRPRHVVPMVGQVAEARRGPQRDHSEKKPHSDARNEHRPPARRVGECGDPAALDDIAAVLDAHGYEPRVQGDQVVLANCPFHTLAREHTALVCDMNLHLITALLDELGHSDVLAGLDPAPQRCCVTLTAEPG